MYNSKVNWLAKQDLEGGIHQNFKMRQNWDEIWFLHVQNVCWNQTQIKDAVVMVTDFPTNLQNALCLGWKVCVASIFWSCEAICIWEVTCPMFRKMNFALIYWHLKKKWMPFSEVFTYMVSLFSTNFDCKLRSTDCEYLYSAFVKISESPWFYGLFP